ncbi:hypothetical protein SAMN05444722_2028 [Rhodovulum sp. ES.010]|uniref:hypothetical protein n=1 Tax=Rhodovulum sp. ES.010 TaxID=1882821 RepID=UPI00092A9F91|nr:hypothetical protein [Rhodovulum sp. ES.010]SIO42053.1 hypothetical protein SAMN05444722_2028 [Rhodovulum sp. ES.010]
MARVAALLSLLVLAACGAPRPVPPPPASPEEVAQLARAIGNLDPSVAEDEAERAARTALDEAHQLAQEYGVTDGPLIHNMKVNSGLRPRGLCYHWADDIEARLRREGFETLELHRAIANADNPFRIEHSTVIVSARGQSMEDGIVLDGWRDGGDLFWAQTRADADYDWVPRQEVFAMKLARDPGIAVVSTAE